MTFLLIVLSLPHSTAAAGQVFLCAVAKSLGVNDVAKLGRIWEHVRLNCTTAAFWVFGCNSQGEHVGLSSGCCVSVLFSISTGW